MINLESLAEGLKELRLLVENINKAPELVYSGGVYKGKKELQTLTYENWIFGYRLENGIMMKRKLFIKVEGYRFDEIPEEQKDPIVTLCFDVFFDQGAGIPEIEPISESAILIWQLFQPGFWYERSPGVVVPGKGKRTNGR